MTHDKTSFEQTIATAFLDLIASGQLDIDLEKNPRHSGLMPFADSDYPVTYETKSPAWEFDLMLRHQVACLQYYFPALRGKGLSFDKKMAAAIASRRSLLIVPSYMERWILLPPSWRMFGKTYRDAVFTVLTALENLHPGRAVLWTSLKNLQDGQIIPNPSAQTALARLAERQEHRGLVVVPVQVGKCYAGRSVASVLQELARSGNREAPFGIIEAALFLLYFPTRLGTDYKGLWMDTPGTIIVGAENKVATPFFRVDTRGRLEIRTSPISESDLQSGTATFYA